MNHTLLGVSRLRCLLVWLAGTLALTGLLLAVRPELGAAGSALRDAGLTDQSFDRLLVWTCAALVALAAAWLWVLTTLVVLEALVAGRPGRGRGVPDAVRRVVLVACGVAVVTA
ncbi:MAG: hypothetical protein JWO11_3052, partial [Nocardioides sp.]|nr:hypothetical protein [Nocardioides sp.]